jgi:tetratricopeptide (TPR) repeat protein
LGLLAAAVLVVAGSYVGPAILGGLDGGPTGAPRVVIPVPGAAALPADGTSGDGRLPLAERIAFWTVRVEEQPSDFLSYVQLAVAWSEQGRLRVDLDAYERADEAVARALAIAPAYPPALAVRASIHFATHDFSGAEADARRALVAAPDDPAALAILGDALLELGRIDEAAATYERLRPIAGGPAFDVRQARLAYVMGDQEAAVEFARKALIGVSGGGAAGAEATDPAQRGFYHFALGEYARLSGDAALAGSEFRAALALRADDIGALLGLARVAAFGGDLEAAVTGLERATAIAPLPESEALLGDLLAARGGPGDAAASATAYGVVRLTATLSGLAGSVYDRAIIAFELDHGGATEPLLERARAAWATRPDAVGRDLVAWALHRLGRDDEAWSESEAARATGAADARLLFHAGAIAAARGEDPTARTLLGRALDLGPALDPAERAEASELLATVTP